MAWGPATHSLKGACANVGADTLSELAFQVEQAGNAGDLDPVRDVIQDIEEQFGFVREATLSAV